MVRIHCVVGNVENYETEIRVENYEIPRIHFYPF